MAEKHLLSLPPDKEYLPIDGSQDFCKGARGVLLGWDHPDVTSGRVVSAQALSGTGALRVAAEFLGKYRTAPILMSTPSYANHMPIFANGGLPMPPHWYRYYNPQTKNFDFDGMVEDLSNAQAGSIVLLHACAHNPTGFDPNKE